MESTSVAVESKALKWKLILLKAAGIGFGIGLAICLSVWLWSYWGERPKPWDKSAVVGEPIDAAVVEVSKLDGSDSHAELWLKLILKNNTANDYQLRDDLAISLVARSSGALDETDSKTPKVFVPSHHSVTTSFSIRLPCDLTGDNPKERAASLDPCSKQLLRDDEAIAIFDEFTKYEIRVPLPPKTTDWPNKT